MLSEHTVWYSYAGQKRCLKPASKPLEIEKIVEQCKAWKASKVILLLEFPWILTHYELAIPLSAQEFKSYAQMRLGFPKVTESDQFSQTEISPTSELPVGGQYFKQKKTGQIGSLSAMLSQNAIDLKAALKTELHVSVEIAPLINFCIPYLLKKSDKTFLFKGIEQSYFIKISENGLQTLVELPSMGNLAQKNFVKDQFALDDQMVTYRLFPKVQNVTETETAPKALDNKPSFEDAEKNIAISMESVLSEWKGLAKSPSAGFWWTNSSKNGSKNKKRVIYGILFLLVILSSSGFIYYFTQLFKQTDHLNQEAFLLEKKLEEILTETEDKSLIKRQQQIEVWEEFTKTLIQEAFWKKQIIQKIFISLEGAWLENFYLQENSLRLELLSMNSINAVDVYLRLSKIPEFKNVIFKSMESVTLKKQQVLRFILTIQLNQLFKKN